VYCIRSLFPRRTREPSKLPGPPGTPSLAPRPLLRRRDDTALHRQLVARCLKLNLTDDGPRWRDGGRRRPRGHPARCPGPGEARNRVIVATAGASALGPPRLGRTRTLMPTSRRDSQRQGVRSCQFTPGPSRCQPRPGPPVLGWASGGPSRVSLLLVVCPSAVVFSNNSGGSKRDDHQPLPHLGTISDENVALLHRLASLRRVLEQMTCDTARLRRSVRQLDPANA
jgi:hypothetical protein